MDLRRAIATIGILMVLASAPSLVASHMLFALGLLAVSVMLVLMLMHTSDPG
jgi:hypothetical protein